MRQAVRRKATSGLSCSAACAVFFERHGVTVEKAPDRARSKACTMLTQQHLGNLHQRHINFRIDRRKDDRSINLNALRAPVTPLTPRRP